MMKALAFLPFVSAVQVMDTHEHQEFGVDSHASYDGMKATLKGISAMQQKGDIDQGTIQIVEEILMNISTQLLDALDEDRKHSQSILDTAEGQIDACDTAKTGWVSGDFNTNNGAVGDALLDHNTCRGLEQSECANATNHCNTYTGQVCAWNRCAKPATSRFSNGDTDELNTYICCLEQFFADEKATYYTHRQNCLDAVNTWESKAADCDVEQGEFEKEFCDREQNVESTCRTYRECRNREQTNYVTVKNQVQELQQIFQAQRVALACLQCYGAKILANATDLSDCEDDTVTCEGNFPDDCPVIVFDAIPDCLACDEPNEEPPCSTDFLADYATLFDNSCSPVDQCQACSTWHSGFEQTEKRKTCETVAATDFENAQR